MALVAHLLYTCLNGAAYVTSASAYFVFIRVYAVPIVYLITLILVTQENERLVSKGLNYFFLSISVVVFVALAQYLNILQIPTGNWVDFGKYLTFGEAADLTKGTGIVSQRMLFGLSGIRINLLLGGSLGTIAALILSLALIHLFFKNTITSNNRFLTNIYALICIAGSLLTFSTSLLTAFFWIFFWVLVYKKISLFAIGAVVVVSLLFLQSQLIFGVAPLTYFADSVGESFATLYQQNLLLDWLIGIGPTLTVAGYTIRPTNYITDVGIFKVMQESGIINMLFVILFLIFTYKRIFYSLKTEMSKQRIACAIILSTCLTAVHANSIIQVPINILFALAIAGSLRPTNIIKSETSKPTLA
jgi:hypothetical protein